MKKCGDCHILTDLPFFIFLLVISPPIALFSKARSVAGKPLAFGERKSNLFGTTLFLILGVVFDPSSWEAGPLANVVCRILVVVS